MSMRLGVVIYLALLSMWVQPTEVWKVRLITNLVGDYFCMYARRIKSYVSCLNTQHILLFGNTCSNFTFVYAGNCLIKCPILL